MGYVFYIFVSLLFLFLSISNLYQDQMASTFNIVREKWRNLLLDSYHLQQMMKKLQTSSLENTIPLADEIPLRPQELAKQYSSKQEILNEIAKERNERITEFKRDAIAVKELFVETSKLLELQKPMIEAIETQIDEVEQETEDGMNRLATVKSMFFSSYIDFERLQKTKPFHCQVCFALWFVMLMS